MSIKIMSRIWESAAAEGGELLVLLALGDWADDRGVCYPSIPVLAEKSRLSERAVQYALARLAERGEIRVDRGGGRGRKNVYHVLSGLPLAGVTEAATKGAKTAPFKGPVKDAGIAPFTPERVQFGAKKGCSLRHPIKDEPSVTDPSVKKQRERTPMAPAEDRTAPDRLLSLSFPAGVTEKQKTALLTTAVQARREGIPWPWMAWAVVSTKIRGAPEPWKRIDKSMSEARRLVALASEAGRKRFRDLAHLVEYAQGGGDGLPASLDGIGLKRIVEQATTWPEAISP